MTRAPSKKITFSGVARLLGIGVGSLQQYQLNDPTFPKMKLPDVGSWGSVYFDRQEIERWSQANPVLEKRLPMSKAAK